MQPTSRYLVMGLEKRAPRQARTSVVDATRTDEGPSRAPAAVTSMSLYEELLEADLDGVVVVSEDGTILLVNRQAEVLFGRQRAEFIGQPMEILLPSSLRGLHGRHLAEYLAYPRTRSMAAGEDLVALRGDGAEVPVDISLTPIRFAEETVVKASIRDATVRLETERQRGRQGVELQRRGADLERSNHRLRARSRAMIALANGTGDLQRCSRLDEALEIMGVAAPSVFDGTSGTLYAPAAGSRVLASITSWGGSVGPGTFAPEACSALRFGSTFLYGDGSPAPPCPHALHQSAWSACIPFVADNQILAFIHLDSRGTGDSTTCMPELVELISTQWGLTLANLRLRDSLREQSVRDPLTGLFNRRYLDEALDQAVHRAARIGADLCVVMIDLDHFKAFNDSHGHLGGDILLRDFGRFLLESTRGEDVVSRFGGEEFALVLDKMSTKHGAARVEDLLVRWGRRCEDVSDPQLRPYPTFSAGLAYYRHGQTGAELLAIADRALYRAKAAGRARVAAEDR